MPGPQQNMAVDVNVFLNGMQNPDNTWTVVATYTQGGTAPLSALVVDPGGDIDLTKLLDPNNEFLPATDIAMTIDNESLLIDNQGNQLNIQFPNQPSSAITFSGTDATTEFVNVNEDGGNKEVGFTDNDDQTGNYSYCLSVYAYANGNPDGGTIIPLDPNIVNRPQ
jgi:hypothetical protein